MNGLLITLEGPDGSGKSTLVNLLSSYLQEKGYEIILTREPGGTKIGEKIRDIILDNENIDMSYTTEALLYAASRAQHVYEKIIPGLRDGKIIICERFVHSSLVYQGIGRGLGIEKIKEINDFAIQGVKPDITLFFDIDPEVALERKINKNTGDRLEREDIAFHRKVYEGYLKIKEMYPDEIKIIDANKTIDEIFTQVKNIIEPILLNKKVGE
jgi:dTMP kinase